MSRVLQEILNNVDIFKNQIANLKKVAPLYPEIYEEVTIDGTHWATTMVKFIYNDVEFKRHHVESFFPMPDCTDEKMIERLKHNCELTIKHAIPCQFDDVIGVLKH